VRDDQSSLRSKSAQCPENEGTPLAREGRLLGRQGRVTRGAVLSDAEVDRRSPAGRLAAVLGLVRDDAEQPGPEGRAGPKTRQREVRLGEPVLGGVLGFGREPGARVRGPGGEGLVAPHQLAVCLGVSVLRAFHEYSIHRPPALHAGGSPPSYIRPANPLPSPA